MKVLPKLPMSETTKAIPSGEDIIKQFQLSDIPIQDKSSKEFGEQISKKIWGQVSSGLGGYFNARNARFKKNRNYANGRIDSKIYFSLTVSKTISP